MLVLQREKQTIMNKAARWLEERDGYGKPSWLLSPAGKDGVWPGLNSLSSSRSHTGKSPRRSVRGLLNPTLGQPGPPPAAPPVLPPSNYPLPSNDPLNWPLPCLALGCEQEPEPEQHPGPHPPVICHFPVSPMLLSPLLWIPGGEGGRQRRHRSPRDARGQPGTHRGHPAHPGTPGDTQLTPPSPDSEPGPFCSRAPRDPAGPSTGLLSPFRPPFSSPIARLQFLFKMQISAFLSPTSG